MIYDVEGLLAFIARHRLTELLFTPTLFNNVVTNAAVEHVRGAMRTLRTIWLNGEVVSAALATLALQTLPDVAFFNLYSISECHEVALANLRAYDLAKYEFCPVGFPTALATLHIVDPDTGAPVTRGDPGELYIGGPLLARGYLAQPELTAARFPDSFGPSGARVYRTGDLARLLPDGMLQIIGRCDGMVKVRGYSVVLAQIEQQLMRSANIKACSVVAEGEEGEEKRLVAMVVPGTEEPDADNPRLREWSIDPATGHSTELRSSLEGNLALYMIPSAYIQVPELPLHPVAGKLDVKAVKAMARAQRASAERSKAATAGLDDQALFKFLRVPADATATQAAAAFRCIVAGVLELPSTAVQGDARFAELGGHSLSAARCAGAVRAAFGVTVPPALLLEPDRTLDGVIAALEAARRGAVIEVAGGRAAASAAAELPADLAAPAPSSGEAPSSLHSCAALLITGATGYFGAHLVAALLKLTDAKLFCLVRGAVRRPRPPVPAAADAQTAETPCTPRGELCRPRARRLGHRSGLRRRGGSFGPEAGPGCR